MDEKNLPRFERIVVLSLSADEESRKAGDSKQMKVTFVIEAGWTLDQLIDKLLVNTTSPRVAYASANRGKEIPAKTYTVPKPGMRAVQEMTDEQAVDRLIPDPTKRAAMITKHGSAAKVIEVFNELMG